MRHTAILGSFALGLTALVSVPALAGPTILAETSVFYGSVSDSNSDGPTSGPDPYYLAESYVEIYPESGGEAAAESFGDVDDGIAIFEVYADVFTGDPEIAEEGGSAGATAKFTVSDTLTNTGPASDNAFLSFFISDWLIQIFPGDGFLSASVSGTITADGEDIWGFTAGITAEDGFGTPFLTGFGPGGLPSQTCDDDTFCESTTSYTGLLDLGLLAPGESVDYTYVLEASVFVEDVLEFDIFADASIADPTDGFFAGVGPLPGGGGSGVPTPGAMAILGFGLLGFGAYRRRKSH